MTTNSDTRPDSWQPDDPGQDYIDCPNCAAGRIYSLECDMCGWEEGKHLRDWSYRRRPPPEQPS